MHRGILAASLLLTGCLGSWENSDRDPRAPSCNESTELGDPGPIRRLSDAQYANTIRDLGAHFGVSLDSIGSPFPGRGNAATFSTAYASNTVSAETAMELGENAEAA